MRARDSGMSLGPVMTFRAENEWLAVRIAQMDRVVVGTALFPVPLARANYLGLLENGPELVPVLKLGRGNAEMNGGAREHLVVILHVRGESVGMAIDLAGHLYERYELGNAPRPPPDVLQGVAGYLTAPGSREFWLIDTDQLWPDAPELPTKKSA